MPFAVGDAVEVAGAAADGFAHAWFRGRVAHVRRSSTRVAVADNLEVAFEDFVRPDTGAPEIELHSARSLRVRPPQPALTVVPSLAEYQLGEAVDVEVDSIWWHAVVLGRRPSTGLRVYFLGSEEVEWVGDAACLRPGKVFVGGAWHPRSVAQLPKHLERELRLAQQPQRQQHQAPKQQQQQQQQPRQQQPAKAAGGKARPASSNDENDDAATVLVRRSARERESRIVMIDGKPVLKLNQYDLEGGKRSVFEQELNRSKPGRGKAAADGPAATWVAVQNPAKRHRLSAAAASAAGKGSAGVEGDPGKEAGTAGEEAEAGPTSPTKGGRADVLAHNAAIKAEAQAMQGQRYCFLEEQLQVLRPFVTADVAASIRGKAAEARGAGLPALPPPVEVQPECIAATLREYQLEGLRWMVRMWDRGVNAILADEMGLGKTLQTISLLSYLKFERDVQGPHLVVVPLSVLPSWMSEFARWSPQMRVVRIHTSDREERERLKREVFGQPNSFDVAVTTYEMAKSKDMHRLLGSSLRWRYLVLDEGHRIKNEETQLAHAMRLIHRQQTLLLTGTPLQNNLHELYALLSYLYPDVFTTSDPFDAAFDLRSKEHKVDAAQLEAVHHMLAPFCLRRLKQEVELGMPPLVETRIYCPLSLMQTFWYRRLLIKDSAALLQIEKEVEGKVKYDATNHTYKKLHMLVAQLRKCCNHPYLFPGAEPEFDGQTTDEGIVAASGKMEVLDRLLGKLKRRGHRVVLFSQFNMQLDILEDYVRMRGYKYARLDGSTNRVQRMIDIKLFNRPGSETFVYLLNTRAGGLGVNLQTADTCILYDSDWNPQCDLQAMARVHRIGQTKPVHVYRLCTGGTVEERIQHRAEKKLYLDQMVNRGAVAGMEGVDSMSKEEMLGMLRFGADRIFQAEAGRTITDAELDAIINRSSSRAAKAAKADKKGGADLGEPIGSPKLPQLVDAKATAASFDAQTAPLSSYIFGGKNYKEDSLKDIGRAFWVEHGKGQREKKERLVMVDGYAVLRENMYGMSQGEPSVFEREAAGQRSRAQVKKAPAGRTYTTQDWCQICWDGGELIECDYCPAVYHADCLGLAGEELLSQASHLKWGCPAHTCAVCARKAGAVGGMLFCCEGCANAFCEDHLPEEADVVMDCKRFERLGWRRPATSWFVRCTPECGSLVEALESERRQRRAAPGGKSPATAAAAGAAAVDPTHSPAKASGKTKARNAPGQAPLFSPSAAAVRSPGKSAPVAVAEGQDVRFFIRSPGQGLAAAALGRSPAGAALARRRSSLGGS